ncbi:glycosyltransferase [Hymenobacter sp. BT491]|uniref:glycosyltransferase n=1 Tax=Hymenobacter sp. BT491 TaxID=2766779 RepID=UPI0016536206|nr:glycosyltransferase [Hymenobacter sp. BT491]MBC6992202.1 glycosyltransferase [Hymenobacter sp. BT491]
MPGLHARVHYHAGTTGVVGAAPPATWPLVAVQLPLYNEQNVVERMLDAAALDYSYPANRLLIQVLDDSTDATVALAARVAHYQAQGLNIRQVRRPTRQGYKADALAHGLAETGAEFVAIFDADLLPAPNFLRRVILYFTSPGIGTVQTRWGHLNEYASLLTRMQAFGLKAHFLVEQVGRQAGGHFFNFNGTGGVWRRVCIEDAGGWHADTLTEDLDLSYRAQLSVAQLQQLPGPVLLDTREAPEFAVSHLRGARLVGCDTFPLAAVHDVPKTRPSWCTAR